ncbi:MAG: hypothetical protein RL748_561 [Pseudomonadota bacterium]
MKTSFNPHPRRSADVTGWTATGTVGTWVSILTRAEARMSPYHDEIKAMLTTVSILTRAEARMSQNADIEFKLKMAVSILTRAEARMSLDRFQHHQH